MARTLLASCLLLLAGCATPAPRLATVAAPGLEGEPRALSGRLDELRRATLARDAATLREALAAPEGPVRAAAVRGLGRCQELADAPALAPLLADREGSVREEAAVALGLLGLSWAPPSAAERAALDGPLVARVVVEEDLAAARAVAWALGRTAGPGAPEALARLAAGADATVRAEALFSRTAGSGSGRQGHRRLAVLRHLRPDAAPRGALHRLRPGHRRAGGRGSPAPRGPDPAGRGGAVPGPRGRNGGGALKSSWRRLLPRRGDPRAAGKPGGAKLDRRPGGAIQPGYAQGEPTRVRLGPAPR